MRVINSHVHVGPSIALGINISPEDVELEMESAGVSECLVFPFPSWAAQNSRVNSWIYELCTQHDSFHPVFYARDNLEIPEFRYVAVKWHWVRGVSDSRSNYDVFNDEKLDEFVEEVTKQNLPLIFEEEFEFTKIFVDRFEDASLIIPHLGALGGSPHEFLNEFENFDNVYFDTSLSSVRTLQEFVDRVGERRIIFGSDLPFSTMKIELDKVMRIETGEREREMILRKNIERLCNFR